MEILPSGRVLRRIGAALPVLLPILFLMALTVWIRLLPERLEAAEIWAWENVRSQVAEQLDPRLPEPQREAALNSLLENNRQVVAETQAELAESFREDVSFIGEDGQRRPFLAGDDSYYFLRQARDILRHGSICGSISDGQCIDTLANAPLGRAVEKPYSIHPFAIAALHSVLGWFQPGIPLSASATLLPTLLTVAVVPFIFLALYRLLGLTWRSGRPDASLAAVVGTGVILLNLPLVGRSLAGDNDIWVAVLPIVAALLLCLELDLRHSRLRRSALAGGAGLLIGLLAASWGGWHLFVAIFLSVLGGLVLRGLLVQHLRGTGLPEAGHAGLTLVTLAGVATGVVLLLSQDVDIVQGLRDVAGALGISERSSRFTAIPEANAFASVAELQKIPVIQMDEYFGPAVFLLGLCGPLLSLLPVTWPPAIRLAATPLFLAIFLTVAWIWPTRGFQVLALAMALLTAVLALLHARKDVRPPVLALLTAVWLFATLMLSHEGQRYLLLLGTPLGLGTALAVAFLVREAWPLAARHMSARLRMPAGIVAAAALLAGIGLPALMPSVDHARLQVPRVNQAWATVLDRVRLQSPPESIVATWWDYGHFITYLAERSTVVDGASLRYSAVHWTGRVLAAADPAEARGLLRMLACGGTQQGLRPYEALLAAGLDRAQALSLLAAVVKAERSGAQAVLEAARLPPTVSGMILRYTHCTAPPQILVTTDALLRTPAWALSGFWNPDLAWLIENRHAGSELNAAIQRLGLSAQGVTEFLESANAARSDLAKALLAAPGSDVWSTGWQYCRRNIGNQMTCNLNLRSADGMGLQKLHFDPAAPEDLWIDAIHPQGSPVRIKPRVVRVALADRLLDLTHAGGAELAVTVDPTAGRVFVSSPAVARSLLVRLTLLDGRYDGDWLENLARSSSVNGETVAAWQVRRQ